MEFLSQKMEQSMDLILWKPFRLGQSRLNMPHLLFANDILLIARADYQNASTINQVLTEFGNISGLKINLAKSKIFFSENINHQDANYIRNHIHISRTFCIGK